MKTMEELKAEQAAEAVKLEQELKIAADLKSVPGFDSDKVSICIHNHRKATHASVTLWPTYRTEHKFAEAVAIVELFKDKIVDGEHWKDGCCSTWPAEINDNASRKSAVMDGSHAVEIEVKGGRGYGPDVCVQFWTRLGGLLCEVSMPVCDLYALVPRVSGRYNQHGEFRGKAEWNPAETQTADSFRTWWSEPPSFSGSYYLADVPNFMSWASNHGSK